MPRTYSGARPDVRTLNAAGLANESSAAEKEQQARDAATQAQLKQEQAATDAKNAANQKAIDDANAAQSAKIRAADPTATTTNSVTTGTGSTAFAGESSAFLSNLEAAAQQMLAGGDLTYFNQTQQILQNIATATPDQRQGFIDQLKAAAKTEVDTPIDAKEDQIKADLQSHLDKLVDLEGAYTKADQDKFNNSIKSLDYDTAENLYNGLTDIDKRGGDPSGLAKRLADKLIDQRGLTAAQAQQTLDEDTAVKNARYGDQQLVLQQTANDQLQQDEDLKKANEITEPQNLIKSYEQQSLTQDQQSGAANIPGQYGDPPPAVTPATTAASVRSTPAPVTPITTKISQSSDDTNPLLAAANQRAQQRAAAIRSGTIPTYNANTLLQAYSYS